MSQMHSPELVTPIQSERNGHWKLFLGQKNIIYYQSDAVVVRFLRQIRWGWMHCFIVQTNIQEIN